MLVMLGNSSRFNSAFSEPAQLMLMMLGSSSRLNSAFSEPAQLMLMMLGRSSRLLPSILFRAGQVFSISIEFCLRRAYLQQLMLVMLGNSSRFNSAFSEPAQLMLMMLGSSSRLNSAFSEPAQLMLMMLGRSSRLLPSILFRAGQVFSISTEFCLRGACLQQLMLVMLARLARRLEIPNIRRQGEHLVSGAIWPLVDHAGCGMFRIRQKIGWAMAELGKYSQLGQGVASDMMLVEVSRKDRDDDVDGHADGVPAVMLKLQRYITKGYSEVFAVCMLVGSHASLIVRINIVWLVLGPAPLFVTTGRLYEAAAGMLRQPSLRWSDLDVDDADIDSLQATRLIHKCDAEYEALRIMRSTGHRPAPLAEDPPFAWDAASATSANSDFPQQRRHLAHFCQVQGASQPGFSALEGCSDAIGQMPF
ncbi:hypothetical protein AK812_SmicGene232 [Symbiodinium microadriaticum]|uniref:Uncharacterized protein n=1 Tax=Symbiodinium microadriaticum TaxID=2951 RepID=A0A1Q9F751_SYMMI|nr:hypothetical protein AK812_SmicGene232 [Symbiodinium microadriaticum]